MIAHFLNHLQKRFPKAALGTTAAQRAELAVHPWTWNDIATYPTLM